MSKYMVFQVGCNCCGVSSYPIAIVDNMDEAEKIKARHPSTWESEGGDGYVGIYNLSDINGQVLIEN